MGRFIRLNLPLTQKPKIAERGTGYACLGTRKLRMELQERIDKRKLAEIWTTAKIRELGIPEYDAAALAASIHLWEKAEGRGQRGNNLSINELLWARSRRVGVLRELYECLQANSKMLREEGDIVGEEKAENQASRKPGKKVVELGIAEIVQDPAMQPSVVSPKFL
jgi:hypothetical protein